MSARTRPHLTSFLVAVVLAMAAAAAIGGIALGSSADRATPAATSGRSLADAAGSPSGVAAGDQPAAEVGARGAPRPAVRPEQVLGSATDRVASTGCQVDYGAEDECLPASPPSAADTDTWAAAETASTRWSCALLRRMFPDGLALRVAAYDPLGLDHDGDGVACDPGDGA